MKAYTTRTVKTYMSPSRKSASPQQAKAADGQITPFSKAVMTYRDGAQTSRKMDGVKSKALAPARNKINNDLINSKDYKDL